MPANRTSWTLSFSENHRHYQRILFGLSVEQSYSIETETVTVSSGLMWNDCTYNVKNGEFGKSLTSVRWVVFSVETGWKLVVYK